MTTENTTETTAQTPASATANEAKDTNAAAAKRQRQGRKAGRVTSNKPAAKPASKPDQTPAATPAKAEPKPKLTEAEKLALAEQRLAERPVYRIALIDASAALTEVQTPLLAWNKEYRHIANVREKAAHMLAEMSPSEGTRLVIIDAHGQVVEDAPTTFATLSLRKVA